MDQKNPFDKNTILVVVLCLGLWWGWQQHLQQKYPEATGIAGIPTQSAIEKGSDLGINSAGNGASEATKSPQKSAELKASHEIESEAASSPQPEKTWVYEDADWRAVVSSQGGRIAEVELKKFSDKVGANIKLLTNSFPGFLLLGVDDSHAQSLTGLNYQLREISPTSVELTGEVRGVKIKKMLEFIPNKFIVKTHIELAGDMRAVKKVNVDIAEPAPPTPDDHKSTFFSPKTSQELQEYFFSHGTKSTREQVTPKDAVEKNFDQTHFAALGSRYFTTLLYNRSNVVPESLAFRKGNTSVLRFSYPLLDSSTPLSLDLDLYAGPKSVQQLGQVDESASKVVDFGFFSIIAFPLLQLMKWFYSIFKNYGVAIIALTILVRMITFPFTYMSYKSMRAMQLIQPQIARLKEVYKDKTTQLNQEMMKLMRENKVNPMGGCLPMLLQLPVFWALYQVLQNSIELYHSPFFGWIHDLSMKDPYYVLPVLMGFSMFAQQKMTPNTMDPAQAKVMLIMPVLFSFLMISLPSGLTLYIFVSTLFGILQQVFMMKDRLRTATPQLSQ